MNAAISCKSNSDSSRGYIEKVDRSAKPQQKQPPQSALIVNSFLSSLPATAKLAVVVGKMPSIRAVATELFDSVESLECESDPDIPGANYVSITVRASGSIRDVADLRREWYRKLHNILGDQYDLVHLAIDLQE